MSKIIVVESKEEYLDMLKNSKYVGLNYCTSEFLLQHGNDLELTNCYDCFNCYRCDSCVACTDCNDCVDCENCTTCEYLDGVDNFDDGSDMFEKLGEM